MRWDRHEGLRHGHPRGRPWTEKEVARLGKAPDEVLARQLGRTKGAVQRKRLNLEIASYEPSARWVTSSCEQARAC
jgi:hypothetical protein